MMTNHYNLVDEKWIPVINNGLVSLKDIFQHDHYCALGGTPIQKISMMKLLLAIAQSATNIQNNEEWYKKGHQGLASDCLIYLDKWYDSFYLYGKQPFLQLPDIKSAKTQPFSALFPEIASGNQTLLTQIQTKKIIEDSDKALLLVTLMGFALSGKKTDNTCVLTPNYKGKSKENGKATSGKPGPSIGHMGFLHTFCLGQTLQESIWFNLMTAEDIQSIKMYSGGLGVAPWEKMPLGENCEIAQQLKKTLMGRLIPMNRFCLIEQNGIHYSEGIHHAGYKDGIFDTSMSINHKGKEPKALWVFPDKKPWRELQSLLNFICYGSNSSYFECLQLNLAIPKIIKSDRKFAIWSSGIQVSYNAGEQYLTGGNDSVDSMVWLDSDHLSKSWFDYYQIEMSLLDGLSKKLYQSVKNYFKSLQSAEDNQAQQKSKKTASDKKSEQASHTFWNMCEGHAQQLIDDCDTPEKMFLLRQNFSQYLLQIYTQFCSNHTARQLDAWAKNKPQTGTYLKRETS